MSIESDLKDYQHLIYKPSDGLFVFDPESQFLYRIYSERPGVMGVFH